MREFEFPFSANVLDVRLRSVGECDKKAASARLVDNAWNFVGHVCLEGSGWGTPIAGRRGKKEERLAMSIGQSPVTLAQTARTGAQRVLSTKSSN